MYLATEGAEKIYRGGKMTLSVALHSHCGENLQAKWLTLDAPGGHGLRFGRGASGWT